MATDLYTAPRDGVSLDDCYFYHVMDLPDGGQTSGEWDLRGMVGEYLGHVDVKGQRVLDVGAASGMLSFWLESQGAEVVSYDLSSAHDWDIVPYHGVDHDAQRADRRRHLDKINNGYWYMHAAHGSKAKVVNGVVYDIPEAIGPVDVSVFGSILLHLRDPFRALEAAAKITTKTMVVADISPFGKMLSGVLKYARFMPKADDPNHISDGWFRLSPLLVKDWLQILGFPKATISWSKVPYGERLIPIYTIVAHREG